MADFTLSLGGVDFADFEIPDSIKAGGAQSLQIKKFGGGKRNIDAFGADDDAITWSGTFFDSTAESRCQQLDAMRKAGTQVALDWSSFSYQVVISKFTFDYIKQYQIAYQIELEVVSDNTQPVTDDGEDDPETVMQGDVDDANTSSDAISDDGLSAAVGAINADLTQAQSITGGSVPFLNTLSADVGTAVGVAQNLEGTFDGETDTLGQATLFAAGTSPASMAAHLAAAAGVTSSLANADGAANALVRLGKNVSNVLSGG